jgi:hypothetical protein
MNKISVLLLVLPWLAHAEPKTLLKEKIPVVSSCKLAQTFVSDTTQVCRYVCKDNDPRPAYLVGNQGYICAKEVVMERVSRKES